MSVGDSSVFPGRPLQIRNRQFVLVRKGFDPDQVRAFLAQVAGHVEALEADLQKARAELEKPSEPEPAAREDVQVTNRMAEVLRLADAHAETIKQEAEAEVGRLRAEAQAWAEEARQSSQAEAERLRGDAQAWAEEARQSSQAEADRVRDETQAEAERMLREAREELEQARREHEEAMRKARTEAEHIVNVLASRRDMLLAEVQTTRERLSEILQKIDEAVPPSPYGAHQAQGEAHAQAGTSWPDGSPEPPELRLPEVPVFEEEF